MAENKFQWCFIGTGTLAGIVAAQLTASGRHEIRSVCSRRFEKAKAFADAWNARAYEDATSAVGAEGVDAVYIVTPHPSHYEMARLALSLGRPVLCEKPFTMRAEEARGLFLLAQEKQVYLAEGMWTWFAPVANQVKAWLDAGEIGRVESVETRFRVNVLDYAPRLTDPALAGGALLDSGVYPLTYLYRLFGKPAEVKCTGNVRGGIDLSEEIDLTFPGGLSTRVSVAIDAEKPDNHILIRGTDGEIYSKNINGSDRAELRKKDGTVKEIREATTLLNEFDRAAEEIRLGRIQSAYVPARATVDVMDIMDECRRQMNLVYPFEKETDLF